MLNYHKNVTNTYQGVLSLVQYQQEVNKKLMRLEVSALALIRGT